MIKRGVVMNSFTGRLSCVVKLACAGIAFGVCLAFGGGTAEVSAAVVTEDITPVEPANSDLEVVHTVTKLFGKRWIQSYTKDSTYYYFIQVTSPTKGHLKITRVKYKGIGKYSRDYMTLKYFGHGTGLDCSVYKGKTYLWTGSDAKKGSDRSTSISCFTYKKNKTLTRHASIRYKIPKKGNGKYVSNVYPAISPDSKTLTVRFTENYKQYYQTYSLSKGRYIKVKKPTDYRRIANTAGDFQGFDIDGSRIYTIEGSPRASFLAGYDKTRVYQPTIVRITSRYTGPVRSFTIYGASDLSFREPEGIKVDKYGGMEMMYVSNLLTDQSCNIYRIKK